MFAVRAFQKERLLDKFADADETAGKPASTKEPYKWKYEAIEKLEVIQASLNEIWRSIPREDLISQLWVRDFTALLFMDYGTLRMDTDEPTRGIPYISVATQHLLGRCGVDCPENIELMGDRTSFPTYMISFLNSQTTKEEVPEDEQDTPVTSELKEDIPPDEEGCAVPLKPKKTLSPLAPFATCLRMIPILQTCLNALGLERAGRAEYKDAQTILNISEKVMALYSQKCALISDEDAGAKSLLIVPETDKTPFDVFVDLSNNTIVQKVQNMCEAEFATGLEPPDNILLPCLKPAMVEEHYTHTLFYIAQVYGNLDDRETSARYCAMTLERQKEKGIDDPSEWVSNATSLGEYYISIRQFKRAKVLLSQADKLLLAAIEKRRNDGDPDYESIPATLNMMWGKLYSGMMLVSRELFQNWEAEVDEANEKHLPPPPTPPEFPEDCPDPIAWFIQYSSENSNKTEIADPLQALPNADESDTDEETNQNYDTEEKGQTSSQKKNDVLPPLPSSKMTFEVSGVPDLVPILSQKTAYKIFNLASNRFTKALSFFQLDGFVSTHCDICLELSNIHRLLADFEPDLENKTKLHRRRVRLLNPLAAQLNPVHYLEILREVAFEVSDAHTALFDVSIEEITQLAEKMGLGPGDVEIMPKRPPALEKLCARAYQRGMNALKSYQIYEGSFEQALLAKQRRDCEDSSKRKELMKQTRPILPSGIKDIIELVPEDDLHSFVQALVDEGRINFRLPCPSLKEQLEHIELAMHCFQRIRSFAEKRKGDIPLAGGVHLVDQMIRLLPVKLNSVRNAMMLREKAEAMQAQTLEHLRSTKQDMDRQRQELLARLEARRAEIRAQKEALAKEQAEKERIEAEQKEKEEEKKNNETDKIADNTEQTQTSEPCAQSEKEEHPDDTKLQMQISSEIQTEEDTTEIPMEQSVQE